MKAKDKNLLVPTVKIEPELQAYRDKVKVHKKVRIVLELIPLAKVNTQALHGAKRRVLETVEHQLLAVLDAVNNQYKVKNTARI